MRPCLRMRRTPCPASPTSAPSSTKMVNTLKKAGVEEILVKGRNSYAELPEKLDCDYYRFLQVDPAAVNAFQNDYMASYSWAEIRNAELGFKME